MFIKRNRSVQGGKTYRSVLLVEGVREPLKRPRGRPAKNAPAKTRVVHRTLANLSRLPEPLIAMIERHCQGRPAPAATPPAATPAGQSTQTQVRLGPCYGVLAGLHALAGELVC